MIAALHRWRTLACGLVATSFLSLGTLSAQETAAPAAAPAAEAPAAPAGPTVEQRIFDLEKYVQNVQPGKDGDATWTSNIAGPGPGHNAWQMTSTALVIFMTLPGLALFYGGLVRKKNVLSVIAQCMGIAGLVTILWWACGYSLSFGGGDGATKPFIGDMSFKFLEGVSPYASGAGYWWISDA
ncbi:hypothetical protein HNQ64_004006, partial [Prosthecobacter dejongeii]|nr:hypothetical protein [Prosthecobacter dejongeii]